MYGSWKASKIRGYWEVRGYWLYDHTLAFNKYEPVVPKAAAIDFQVLMYESTSNFVKYRAQMLFTTSFAVNVIFFCRLNNCLILISDPSVLLNLKVKALLKQTVLLIRVIKLGQKKLLFSRNLRKANSKLISISSHIGKCCKCYLFLLLKHLFDFDKILQFFSK